MSEARASRAAPPMNFPPKDYYKILGVPRTATGEAIKKAFRQHAKKYHPDHNSGRRGEERFKDLSEAYDVLGDPDKRRRYDAETSPRAGPWQSAFAQARAAGTGGAERWKKRDFGDLFNALRAGSGNPGGAEGSATHLESELTISLDEAVRGGARKVTLAVREAGPFGAIKESRRECEIRIPPGIRDGQKIRLRGDSAGAGPAAEEVFIRIRIAPHPVFGFEGEDLVAEVKVSPWEAALGESISVPTLEEEVMLKVPPGVRSGQKLRLRGRGFPAKAGARGDLLYRVMIAVPSPLTPTERALFEKMRELSRFNPRS